MHERPCDDMLRCWWVRYRACSRDESVVQEGFVRGSLFSAPVSEVPAWRSVFREMLFCLCHVMSPSSHHPQDVELLARLLEGVSFEDKYAVKTVAKRFHEQRTAHASTINILANALYQVGSRPLYIQYICGISDIATCMTLRSVVYDMDSKTISSHIFLASSCCPQAAGSKFGRRDHLVDSFTLVFAVMRQLLVSQKCSNKAYVCRRIIL